MKSVTVCRTVALLAALALAAGGAQAQTARWQPFVSFSPVYEGNGDLDDGGDFSVWRALLRAGVAGEVTPGVGAGVTLNYDYADYSFSNPIAFDGAAPWNIVQRYGFSLPLSFALQDGWSIGFVPAVDWFRENGADTGDSLAWGAILSATRRFADGNRLGIGVGVYDRIEDTSAFPFLIVDWRLGERWRLVNPLAAGPTGPAGLELDYQFDNDWTLGIGAAWRTTRFRLSKSGPVPDGIGEERGVPVFVRATRNLGTQSALHLYAGTVVAGELRVEDSSGNNPDKVDYDPSLLLGLTITARF
jgi:hypothetical protein